MPKTKLEKLSEQQTPPIDWLLAAILERKMVLHISLKELATHCDVSYESMRQYIRKSPWEWPLRIRKSACEHLGISYLPVPKDIRTTERVEKQ